MKESTFSDKLDLDIAYLEILYDNDLESAKAAFKRYLDELPSNLFELKQSIVNHDIYRFLQLCEKLRPEFNDVGLTDVGFKLKDMQEKCIVAKDMILYQTKIREVIASIEASKKSVKQILDRLPAG
jgi:hypothetical protein